MAVVLVSHCQTGMGLAAAVALAARGHHVFATMPNLALSGELEQAAAAAGVGMEVGPLDLTDQWSIDACVTHVLGAAGAIDAVVDTTPCPATGADPLADPLAELDVVVASTLTGPLRLLGAVLPALRRRQRGLVVFGPATAGDADGVRMALRRALAGIVAEVDAGPGIAIEVVDETASADALADLVEARLA